MNAQLENLKREIKIKKIKILELKIQYLKRENLDCTGKC